MRDKIILLLFGRESPNPKLWMLRDALDDYIEYPDRLLHIVANGTPSSLSKLTEQYNRDMNGSTGKYVGTIPEDFKCAGISKANYKLFEALMKSEVALLANYLRIAVQPLQRDERMVSDILCNFPAETLYDVSICYHHLFHRDLGLDLSQGCDKILQSLYLSLLNTTSRGKVTWDLVKDARTIHADVSALYKAGQNRVGVDTQRFISVFGGNSRQYLELVSWEYIHTYGTSLDWVVGEKFIGSFRYALLSLLKSPVANMAKILRTALSGFVVDETSLIRVFSMSRHTILPQIEQQFDAIYEPSLEVCLNQIKSPFYMTLLALLRSARRPQNKSVFFQGSQTDRKHSLQSVQDSLLSVQLRTPRAQASRRQ
jgi:hypothetical protein